MSTSGKNAALLERLRALLRAKIAAGQWKEEWNRHFGKAFTSGFVDREKPGHILQTVKGKMGHNEIGGATRVVLGSGSWSRQAKPVETVARMAVRRSGSSSSGNNQQRTSLAQTQTIN
jgi:hypothetical protein